MKKAFSFAAVAVLALAFSLSGCGKSNEGPALAEGQKLVEGAIVDIYDDAAAGEAYVTLKTADGPFILDCAKKGFDDPIDLSDSVKVVVENVRVVNGRNLGDLHTVLGVTKSK
jgi:hypothetical protein